MLHPSHSRWSFLVGKWPWFCGYFFATHPMNWIVCSSLFVFPPSPTQFSFALLELLEQLPLGFFGLFLNALMAKKQSPRESPDSGQPSLTTSLTLHFNSVQILGNVLRWLIVQKDHNALLQCTKVSSDDWISFLSSFSFLISPLMLRERYWCWQCEKLCGNDQPQHRTPQKVGESQWINLWTHPHHKTRKKKKIRRLWK